MNNKPKTLKYRVTVGTDQPKEFGRHRDMKKFVRSLDPAQVFFNTEYWNRRSGINGAYMPSWEWSTEGQMQYRSNLLAHSARKEQHVKRQLDQSAKAKSARIAANLIKKTAKQSLRHAERTAPVPSLNGERVVSARPVHSQANKARKGYVPKVYGKKVG
jgi:hypothetical protein